MPTVCGPADPGLRIWNLGNHSLIGLIGLIDLIGLIGPIFPDG